MSPGPLQPDCYTNTDYDIGKRLFNVHLVLKMVESSPNGRIDESLVEADRFIDSKAFDFEKALAAVKDLNCHLPRTDPIGNESVEDFIYKILGFIRLDGSRNDFVLLIGELLLQDLRQPGLDETAGCYTSPVPTQYSSNSNNESDGWKYTSLLWEKAQVHGVKPDIKETCLSNFPPRFRVTISYMGTQASGEGRTKKLAKHLAARHVCQTLGIQL